MELDLSSNDQDKVIYLCVIDDEFMSLLHRKKMEPKHFSSSIRQHIFRSCSEFYTEYKKSPKDSITSIIDRKVETRRIKEEDKEAIDIYLDKIFDLPTFSEEYLIDQIDTFVKKRIVSTALNNLIKTQDRFNIDPDKQINIMREAITESETTTGRHVVESISVSNDSDIVPREFVTMFGIHHIDNMLKGGLKAGSYVIIQAFTNVGKSWAANHLAKMGARFGNSSLTAATEISNQTARLRFRMSFSGMTDDEVYVQSERASGSISKSMNKGADIYLLNEEEKTMNVDSLPSVVEETENKTGKKIRLIIIDSADDMLPPIGRHSTPLEANTATHVFLKNYAKNSQICIVSTAQVRREGDTKYWLGPSNVGNNIEKIRKATVGISLNATKAEIDKGYFRVWLFKHTDGNVGARAWVKHNFERGQFVSKYGSYSRTLYDQMIEAAPLLRRERRGE